MQSLERQIKKINFEAAYVAIVAAFGSLDLTVDAVIAAVTGGTAANGNTVTLQVLAAAANPTDTVLCDVTGTSAAMVITITPNDGTNNGATPVPLTTAELVELITTGLVAGKTVTITDTGSLLDEITATGGDTTDLADGGEGDGEVATLAGGVDQDFTMTRKYGIYDITQNGAGDYRVHLEDKYYAFNFMSMIVVGATGRDFNFQVKTYEINPTSGRAYVDVLCLTGATATQLNDGDIVLGELTLKNTSVI